jgi:hypothetical protein
MPGLVPGIHVFLAGRKTWMADDESEAGRGKEKDRP